MSGCSGEARSPGQAVERRGEARRRTVLVVDDDGSVRELLALALQLEGYSTHQAADGLDALVTIRTGPIPDAIVLDLEMPLMSGWEVRAALLADPALARIPVIVVSSSPRAVDASRRLPKPFDLDELLAALRELVPR